MDALLEKLIKGFQWSKLEELGNVPYGILETEQMVLIYFLFENALIPLCTAKKIPYKPILKNLFQYIFALQYDEVNKLFNINRHVFDIYIHSRIRYYKKQYDSNRKITLIQDRLIYTAVSYLYILSADKQIFETDKEPFADDRLIEKETIRIRNDNYQKYGDLDRYFTKHYALFESIYDFANDIAEEMVNNIVKENKTESESENPEPYPLQPLEITNKEPDLFEEMQTGAIIIIILSIIVFSIMFLLNNL